MTSFLKLALVTGAALTAASHSPQAQVTRQAAVGHAPAPIAPPKHILYRVQGPNGATVYLLGSVHLLSAEAATLPAEVDTAFAHARSLTLETSLDSAMQRGQELLLRGQFTDGRTLRGTLSPAAAAKADSLLHGYGLSLDQVNGFKPWLVSMLMAQMAMKKMNFQPQYGVDMQLNTRAKQAQKPVLGLESVDFQLGMFDKLAPADQERLLLESDAPEVAAKQLAAIRDAWSHGDAFALDSLINLRMGDAPAILDAMLTSRNRTWVPKIETLIKGHDDALVVVGAGHLVGKQGVVELLRARGYTIDQM
jgi:uncharacterized protein YbaP (TraB family)